MPKPIRNLTCPICNFCRWQIHQHGVIICSNCRFTFGDKVFEMISGMFVEQDRLFNLLDEKKEWDSKKNKEKEINAK